MLICIVSFGFVFSQEKEAILDQWGKMHSSKDDLYKVYNDAKFGMFIHWGVYSKLGGVWNGVKIVPETHGSQATIGEWIMHSARIPRSEYGGVARTFNPVGFNADQWVKLAEEAGMRYIVVMPKHHDGFAMYHSKVSGYNIYDWTPFRRDPMEELYEACQRNGMRMGVYYSHSIDWMDGGDGGTAQEKKINPGLKDTIVGNTWDSSPVTYQEYLENKAKPQMREILKKFPGLIEVWYDFPKYMNLGQSFDFYKLVYEAQPGCLVNSRVGNGLGDVLTAGDNQIPKEVNSKYRTWETPGTMNNTWGYKSYDNDWKSLDEMLFWIVEIASKGGNYLLNIGPDGNGVIPQASVKLLKGIGAWMKLNGEAIYGTSRWTTVKEGPSKPEMKSTTYRKEHGFSTVFTPGDLWFTKKSNAVYVISLVPPANNKVSVKSLYPCQYQIKKITQLGKKGLLKWEVNGDRVDIYQVKTSMDNEHGIVLKVELE